MHAAGRECGCGGGGGGGVCVGGQSHQSCCSARSLGSTISVFSVMARDSSVTLSRPYSIPGRAVVVGVSANVLEASGRHETYAHAWRGENNMRGH